MQQTTLSKAVVATTSSRKRSAASTTVSSTPAKKRKSTAGTSIDEPIDLLDETEEVVIIVDEDDKPDSGPSEPTAKDSKPKHDGPSNRFPTRINAPDFDLQESLTGVEAQVIKKDPDLDLLYFKQMVKGRFLFEYLLNELPWYRVTYQTRGITIRTPRWTNVWGCDETGAPPSAYKIQPRKIPPVLRELKEHMEVRTGAKYNFVLVNYYENGKDSISWHSDDESFLGPLPCIASLSLGSSRDFHMKHKQQKENDSKVEKWSLQSGDCVVMRGTTQSKWLHSVPKRANAGGRMNLTFRRAMNTGGTNNYYRYNVYTGDVHRWRDGKMEVAP